MKITFLGQGLDGKSDNSVGHYLMKYLNRTDFNSFTGISAFASEAGIFGLSGHLLAAKENFNNLRLIVGIDQGGTSKEALQEILNLNIESFIFYQKEYPIFHPKIYLFESDKKVKLIVGSSNLTKAGLFNNIESSLLIEFNTSDLKGMDLLSEFKSYYKSLFDSSDPNLFKLNNSVIADFVSIGIIPDEATRKKNYSFKNILLARFNTLSNAIPSRTTAPTSPLFLTKKRLRNINATKTSPQNSQLPEIEKSSQLIAEQLLIDEDLMVWESGPLTERDLNIPKGETTNATGSILFKKGKLEGIDQRHHFRDVVFHSLPWANDNNAQTIHLERATAFFHIIIENDYKGVFPLMITHNTKTDTPTYLQKNSMTSLSWGKAKDLIAKENLIGKSIKLYQNKIEPTSYIMHVS